MFEVICVRLWLREAHVLVHHAPPARAVGAADALAGLGLAVGVDDGARAAAEGAGVRAAAAAGAHVCYPVILYRTVQGRGIEK